MIIQTGELRFHVQLKHVLIDDLQGLARNIQDLRTIFQ